MATIDDAGVIHLGPTRLVTLGLLRAASENLCPEADELSLYCSAAFAEFEIDNVNRISGALGTILWESDRLRRLVEGASGDVYENSTVLGNTQPGDGRRYKGRGAGLTGRKNYAWAGAQLGLPLLEQPELAAEPRHLFRIFAIFWRCGAGANLSHKARLSLPVGVDLNALADARRWRDIALAWQGDNVDGPNTHYQERLKITLAALHYQGGGA